MHRRWTCRQTSKGLETQLKVEKEAVHKYSLYASEELVCVCVCDAVTEYSDLESFEGQLSSRVCVSTNRKGVTEEKEG